MKKALIISCAVLFLLGTAAYFSIDYAGDVAIKSIINSVDTTQLDSLQIKDNEPAPSAPVPDDSDVDSTNAPQQTQKAKITPKPEASKSDKIDYNDKLQAINMVTSKFSASEISYYQQKVNEGVTTEIINEVKAKLKSRCTPAEIEQIKEWYNKYK